MTSQEIRMRIFEQLAPRVAEYNLLITCEEAFHWIMGREKTEPNKYPTDYKGGEDKSMD